MIAKQSLAVYVLLNVLQIATSEVTETERQKRMVKSTSASSYDINKCLFQYWTPFVKIPGIGKNPHPGLSEPVKCNHQGLCYGGNGIQAQFAVCYNTGTLIPEFTGHILNHSITGGEYNGFFTGEAGIGPVATNEDYKDHMQLFDKGHLTPNGDFSTTTEREFTMKTTNIAPQRDALNKKNWADLEKALREYANETKHALYIITGTGGAARSLNGKIMRLNNRVLVPKWYWKAVCDPKAQQSIFFWAVNIDLTYGKDKGCYGILQSKERGVIKCSSLKDATSSKEGFKRDFYIPAFNEKYCSPSKMGLDFMPHIKGSLQ